MTPATQIWNQRSFSTSRRDSAVYFTQAISHLSHESHLRGSGAEARGRTAVAEGRRGSAAGAASVAGVLQSGREMHAVRSRPGRDHLKAKGSRQAKWSVTSLENQLHADPYLNNIYNF